VAVACTTLPAVLRVESGPYVFLLSTRTKNTTMIFDSLVPPEHGGKAAWLLWHFVSQKFFASSPSLVQGDSEI
jgi:hypothetical protein